MGDSDRFWAKVEKSEDCWEWKAYRNKDGYGQFKVNGTVIGAHRYSLILSGLSIPVGMKVLHRCDNPPCVNPAHLFLGTQADNIRDMVGKGRHRVLRGEEHYARILSVQDVLRIRQRLVDGEKISQIAKDYGVSWSTIGNIKYKAKWKHI